MKKKKKTRLEELSQSSARKQSFHCKDRASDAFFTS